MFNEDLAPFFNESDFAVGAVWTPAGGGAPVALSVIFDNEYFQTDAGILGDATRQPVCQAADAAIVGMKSADTLVIAGTTYKVKTVRPDGTGVSTIDLAKQ